MWVWIHIVLLNPLTKHAQSKVLPSVIKTIAHTRATPNHCENSEVFCGSDSVFAGTDVPELRLRVVAVQAGTPFVCDYTLSFASLVRTVPSLRFSSPSKCHFGQSESTEKVTPPPRAVKWIKVKRDRRD
ncbi:hypothetical protein BTVI_23051 [Pitangus sulphuratus]|nr:hypothetical protein BTVI_23051 [Pitangus sulphuratus]